MPAPARIPPARRFRTPRAPPVSPAPAAHAGPAPLPGSTRHPHLQLRPQSLGQAEHSSEFPKSDQDTQKRSRRRELPGTRPEANPQDEGTRGLSHNHELPHPQMRWGSSMCVSFVGAPLIWAQAGYSTSRQPWGDAELFREQSISYSRGRVSSVGAGSRPICSRGSVRAVGAVRRCVRWEACGFRRRIGSAR